MLLAGNRDELRDRPALPPARHWEDRPEVVAGLDRLAGGSWLGVSDQGLAAAVMNREGSLGPAADKRSRGELVLEALDQGTAAAAAQALQCLYPGAYRPFNLVVADPLGAYWVRHAGSGPIRAWPIEPGLHMLSAGELDDGSDPRIAAFLPRFQAARVPDPETGDWLAWEALLAERDPPPGAPASAAMNLDLPDGLCTRSTGLLAVPRYPGFGARPRFWFADGAPDRARFEAVL
jgi:uncharacterized protein with NRDE domain